MYANGTSMKSFALQYKSRNNVESQGRPPNSWPLSQTVEFDIAPSNIMQSIFRSAARLRGSMVGNKPGSRAGELKMYWTKPPR
jgi:hypothetical protein